MILSICVPTYNREKEIRGLFESVLPFSEEEVEIVVVDDGSTDNTLDIISYYNEFLDIKVISQENRGRSHALHKAISQASGEFTVLMDSDDFFTKDGVGVILKSIAENKESDAMLFGTIIKECNSEYENLPPKTVSNFVAIRADFCVKNDLKEVVRTCILKECNYQPEDNCRRVPTSLLWFLVSERASCISIPVSVAVKEYLPGGMSDKILQLKANNSAPLVYLYRSLGNSKLYKSNLYRWRSRILYSRYSFHYSKYSFSDWWSYFSAVPGFLFFCLDKIKLLRKR